MADVTIKIPKGRTLKRVNYRKLSSVVELHVNKADTVELIIDEPPVIPPVIPPVTSPDGTQIPPAARIVDTQLNSWWLANDTAAGGKSILKNGALHDGGSGVLLLWKSGWIYTKNSFGDWYMATETGWRTATDPTVPPVVTPPPTTGVFKTNGFDSAADLGGDYGAAFGTLAATTPSTVAGANVRPVIDTAVKCSGAGSMRFDIHPFSNSADASDPCGQFFQNFGRQFKAGQEFFVQLRYRMNQAMFDTLFQKVGGAEQGGFKILSLTAGDESGKIIGSSASGKLVIQTYYQHRFPILYRYVDGVTNNLFTPIPPPPLPLTDQNLQPREIGVCSYVAVGDSGKVIPAGCYGFVPDNWMHVQVGVKLGALAADNYWDDCNVRLWLGRENEASALAVDWHGRLWAADGNFGKIHLLPYMTTKSPTQDHPLCQVWYDTLQISDKRIDDPVIILHPGNGTPLPAYVPAQGFYKEFTLNEPEDVGGALDETMISTWNGCALVTDYGTAGGIAYRGGGHVGFDDEYGGVLVLNLATRLYEMRCIPALAPQNRNPTTGDARDAYGAFSANGAPTREHTYNDLQQMPASWGGGSSGSLVQVGMPGGLSAVRGKGCCYRFDLSQTVDGHHNLTDEFDSGSFPYDFGDGVTDGVTDTLGTAIDTIREGWWTKSSLYTNNGGKLLFTSKTGEVTALAQPIATLERCWLHHFADDDLIVWGASFGPSNVIIRVCDADGSDTSWTTVTEAGTPPPPLPGDIDSSMSYMGMKWFTLLNCFVGLNVVDSIVDSTHMKVWKLTPPAPGSRKIGTWTWSTEVVASADASAIAQADIGFANGSFGKFIEVPALRSAVWTRSLTQKGQLFRLAGM